MSQQTIVLACPTCKRTCRNQRETRPGAKMRCPGCNGVFRFFVHGNGAVELQPLDDKPATEPLLPPRLGDEDGTKGARTIFTSRRRNRPIGGYAPFEKSRSYVGTFAFWAVLGLGSLVAYLYYNKIDSIVATTGKGANDPSRGLDEAKRKDHQAKAKRGLEELKKRPTKAQPAEAKVGPGKGV